MIEIGKGKSPAVIGKVQADGAGNVGKSAVAVVVKENVALIACPGPVGADQLDDGVPAELIRKRGMCIRRRLRNHLLPEEAFQVVGAGAGNHAVGDIQVRVSVLQEIPGVAGP